MRLPRIFGQPPENGDIFAAAPEGRLVALVDQLRSECGLPREPEKVREAVQAVLNAQWQSANDRAIPLLLDQVGLSGTPLTASLSEMRSAGFHRPAIVMLPDRPPDQWLAVGGRQGSQVRVIEPGGTEPRWVKLSHVADRLGVTTSEPLEWLVVFSALPLETMRASEATGGVRSPFSRLWSLVVAEREDLLVLLVFAAGVGLLTLATPIAVQALVNSVAFGTLLQPLVVLALLLLAGLAFSGVLAVFETYVVEILQRRIFVRVTVDLSQRLPRTDLERVGPSFGPQLVNRFFDVFTVQKATAILLIEGLDLLLKAAVGLLVLALYHPLLLVFDLVLIGCLAFVFFVLGRTASDTAVKESKAKYQVAEWLEAVARSPITFKSETGASYARARVDDLAYAYLTARGTHFRVVLRQTIGAVSLQAIASAALLGVGGWLVIERELTLGQLVAAELIVAIVVSAFGKLGKQLETFYDLLAAVDKLGNLVDLPLEQRSGETLVACEDGVHVSITGLGYRHGGGTKVLRDASLCVEPGESVAIVGSSASGKSTFLDILYGLRRPHEGSVSLCGQNIEDLSPEEVRSQVILLRDVELVEGSILENVRLGREGVTTTQVRNVLAELGLIQTIMRLPQSLHTPLGPTGAPLSSSQAKLLVLGRALVQNPGLLLLDGYLDDLDRPTRKRACEVLMEAGRGWTVLLASDEIDLVGVCSRTVRLANGRFQPVNAAA